jgi:hypothetical protein
MRDSGQLSLPALRNTHRAGAFLLLLSALAAGRLADAGDIPIRWQHLTSRNGDLPVPGSSTQQTGALVADLDRDGLNDFVLSFRQQPPALVCYRRNGRGWTRQVLDPTY